MQFHLLMDDVNCRHQVGRVIDDVLLLGEHRLFTLRNNVSICGFLAQRQKRKHDKGTAKGTLNSVVLIYASFDFLWNESFTILGEVQSNLCMAFVAFHSIERFAW